MAVKATHAGCFACRWKGCAFSDLVGQHYADSTRYSLGIPTSDLQCGLSILRAAFYKVITVNYQDKVLPTLSSRAQAFNICEDYPRLLTSTPQTSSPLTPPHTHRRMKEKRKKERKKETHLLPAAPPLVLVVRGQLSSLSFRTFKLFSWWLGEMCVYFFFFFGKGCRAWGSIFPYTL